MAKNYAEAKALALAAGIPESQLTAATIALYGYESSDPTASLSEAYVTSKPEEVKADIDAALQEAKDNQFLTNLISKLGGIALKGIGLMLLLGCLVGCGPSAKAKALADKAASSAMAADEQHIAFENSLIEDYRAKEYARIDELMDAAVKSQTSTITATEQKPITVRTIAADGGTKETQETKTVTVQKEVIAPNIYAALMKQKNELYANAERNIQGMRVRQKTISQNSANAVAYNEGLKQYFQIKANTFEQMNAASSTFLDQLDRFVSGKKTVAPPGIATP